MHGHTAIERILFFWLSFFCKRWEKLTSSVLGVFHPLVYSIVVLAKLIGKGHKKMGRVIWSLPSHKNSQLFQSLHLSSLNCMVSHQCRPLALLPYCSQLPTRLGCITARYFGHIWWPFQIGRVLSSHHQLLIYLLFSIFLNYYT